jgi:hypothetical protein
MSFGPSHDPYAKYGVIEENPYDPDAIYRGRIEERPFDFSKYKVIDDPYDPSKYKVIEVSPEVAGRAQALLDFFIGSMGRGDTVAQQFPLSQDEFRDIVGSRIDARGPSIQERLERLGATSFKDAIRKGIMPPPPRIGGV